jgi:photosystem I subunit 8
MSPLEALRDQAEGPPYSAGGCYRPHAMTGEFAAAWMPSVFVPLVGILGPAVAMALLFNVIEARD